MPDRANQDFSSQPSPMEQRLVRFGGMTVGGFLVLVAVVLARRSDTVMSEAPSITHKPAPANAAPTAHRAEATSAPSNAHGAWQAATLSHIELQEYLPSASADGFHAPNRAHNLRTHFR